jgi:GntR family histidine utilization transcriptional repressor
MQIRRGDKVFHLKAVHFQDELPVLFEDRVVNPRLAPEFLDADFSRVTATGYLVSRITPDEMEHIVQAVLPDTEIAAALDIARSEPCLKLSRRTFKADGVVTAVSLFYPGSRYSLGARYATGDYESH